MTTLTQTQFSELQNLIYDALEIEREEKRLADKKAQNRARLLEIAAPLVTEDSATPIPGVTVAAKRDVKYDETQAIAWALDPANINGAAAFLRVKREMTATVIQLVLANQLNPGTVFELDKTGYAAGVREASHVGMPFVSMTDIPEIRVTAKSLQAGGTLRQHVTVVEDDLEAV